MDETKDTQTGVLNVVPESGETVVSEENCVAENSHINHKNDLSERDENVTDESKENSTSSNANAKEETSSRSDSSVMKHIDTSNPVSGSDVSYEFDGQCYIYKDPSSNVTYRFDNEKYSWVVKEESTETSEIVPKSINNKQDNKDVDDDEEDEEEEKREPVRQDMTAGTYSFEDDIHIYTDPTDGTRYFWDKEKNAWFPKIDDDFLAQYQMNYGFVDNSSTENKIEENKEQQSDVPAPRGEKRKAAPAEANWFDIDDEHNTNVYVSNLPMDVTEQEFIDLMQKCGFVMKDPVNGKMKVKLYSDPETGQLKGDGLCTYIKIESVDLALKLLEDYEFKGKRLHVERAKFQMKGSSYDPKLKPKKLKKKDKEKVKKMQEKLLDWRPDKLRGERAKHERVIIVKNLFQPGTFDKDVGLILEYQQDLREECSKCGTVKKVVIHDRHPEGVAQIFFQDAEEADICLKLLNGRWFGGQQIKAETWDGKTKYKIDETKEETEERLQRWSKFLEEKEGDKKTSEN